MPQDRPPQAPRPRVSRETEERWIRESEAADRDGQRPGDLIYRADGSVERVNPSFDEMIRAAEAEQRAESQDAERLGQANRQPDARPRGGQGSGRRQ